MPQVQQAPDHQAAFRDEQAATQQVLVIGEVLVVGDAGIVECLDGDGRRHGLGRMPASVPLVLLNDRHLQRPLTIEIE